VGSQLTHVTRLVSPDIMELLAREVDGDQFVAMMMELLGHPELARPA